jgi:molybdate transport system regulatory protein
MKKAPQPQPLTPTVSYAGALGHAPVDKRIDILRLIGQSGSISQAAREAGVSYKAAWQAIDTLTNLAGVALVERAVGGAGGGGARITPAGVQLLAAAQQLDQARQQVLSRLQQADAGASTSVSSQPAAHTVLGQLAVRTSMRNQLPCRVLRLDGHGQMVRVHLALEGPLTEGSWVSRITLESAELLALQPGQAVLALCKATAVTVARASTASIAADTVNPLAGRATRVSRGDTGDEVSLTLDGGLQLVGFAPPHSGIRAGTRVQALVDEAAVVVALAG